VSIASGLANGRVYSVTLSGLDAFGQSAEVTLSVAVAAADLIPPGAPAPVALVSGSTALPTTLIGSWSAAVTVTASVTVDDASPAPTATVTGTGAGPYSVAIASGLTNGRVYSVALSGQDAFGQVAQVTLSLSVAVAASSVPLWLDIPAGVSSTNNFTPAGPSGTIGTFTLGLPTNASGNTYYRIQLATRADNALPWRNWNNLTRVVSWNDAVYSNGQSNSPDMYRFEVTDDAGNYGIGYHVFGFWNYGPTNTIAYPEIVLEESDPAYSLTFAPFEAGATGTNDATPLCYIVGSGRVSGAEVYLQKVSGVQYQGPFSVDPTPGGVIFMITQQEPGSGSGATRTIIQPIRRRRANGNRQQGGFTRAYELDVTLLDHSYMTMPVTTPQVSGTATPGGVPGYYDTVTINTSVLNAGVAASLEQTNSIPGQGLVTELQTTVTNSRSVGNTLTSLMANNLNSGRLPAYSNVIPVADEIVFRSMGRIDMTNASTSNTGFVDWMVASYANTDGPSGLRFQLNQGMPSGFVTNDFVSVGVYQSPSVQRRRAQIPRTDLLSRDIGMDVYMRGGQSVVVVYQWAGSFPSLASRMPYAGLRHWVFEHARYVTNTWTGGEPDFIGANTAPWLISTTQGRTYMQQAVWGCFVSLGGSGAATMRSVIKRVAIEHRPRFLITGV